ncbi:hypothetical protein [Nonomuraea sp. NEAU-A123]|uniref:hypothetical protein n=1 Tax=Nonomuraea sp. NEAU-A123 TaxID=2839649 RepID=UPI001BE45AAE|nr:hypothetical protein [Nonomuraea sp. NEAU-A123]MBT2233767.1 hypothetical protein [Nonomuraea sp. NEAU-A123]
MMPPRLYIRIRIGISAVGSAAVRFGGCHLGGLVVVPEHNRVSLALGPALAATDFTAASLYATLRSADPAQLP